MSHTVASERKGSQRERLVRAMTAVAGREGYAEMTIAKVIAEAGVSRPTFYDYFSDKQDCFAACQRETGELLLKRLGMAVREGLAPEAADVIIRALVGFARESQLSAKLLLCAALEAGPAALDEHDRVIAEAVGIIERSFDSCSADASLPDLPVWTLIGCAKWLLSRRLRRDEDLDGLTEELICWVGCYRRPLREHRWRTLEPAPVAVCSPFVSELPSQAPAVLTPGRSRLSSAEVARNQRERIMHATASVLRR